VAALDAMASLIETAEGDDRVSVERHLKEAAYPAS
jgi:hypothetical protein